MKEQLESFGAVDRATWRTWQLFNVAAWSLAGIAAATLIHLVAGNIDTIVRGWGNLHYPTDHTVRTWLAVVDLVVSGVAVGSIIGRHVFRSAPAYAGMAATVAVLLPIRFDVIYDEIGLVLALAIQVGVAFAFAVRAERRRPLALRGGHHGSQLRPSEQ